MSIFETNLKDEQPAQGGCVQGVLSIFTCVFLELTSNIYVPSCASDY